MSFTNAQLAQQIANLVEYWASFNQEYSDWIGGTVTGGPNSDGEYPLTNWAGEETLLPCPALLSDNVTGYVAIVDASAQAASASEIAAALSETNAAASAVTASAQAALADADRIAAELAETGATDAKVTAIAQAAAAVVSAANALASEQAAAASEAAAAISEANAAASEAAAATFDPALFMKLDGTQAMTGKLSGLDASFSQEVKTASVFATGVGTNPTGAALRIAYSTGVGYLDSRDFGLATYKPLSIRSSGLTVASDLTATGAVTGSNLNVSNWDTAYGWGDHSTQNYAVTTGDTFTGAVTVEGTITAGGNQTRGVLSALADTLTVPVNDEDLAPGKLYLEARGGYVDWSIQPYQADLAIYASTKSSAAPSLKINAAGVITWSGGSSTNANTAYSWGDHSTQNYAATTGDTFTGPVGFTTSAAQYWGDGVASMPNNTYKTGPSIGGWARGWRYVDSVGTTTHGGMGAQGSNDTLTHFSIGFGPTWYGGDNGIKLTSGLLTMAGAITATGNVTGANLNVSNWDTAFGWGDHAGLYAPITNDFALTTGDTFTGQVNFSSTIYYNDIQYVNADAGSIRLSNSSWSMGIIFGTSWNVANSPIIRGYGSSHPTAPGDLEVGATTTGGELRLTGTTIKLDGYTLSSTILGNWQTAYNWGDHGTAGYAELAVTNTFTTLQKVQDDAYAAGTNNYHFELFAPDSGSGANEIALRFHQGSRYYYSLRASATYGGLACTVGNAATLVKFHASQFNTATGDSDEWETAYGWGDHSVAGYAAASAYLPLAGGSGSKMTGHLHMEAATPFVRQTETGVTNTPEWWVGADGGNWAIRLNNTGTYPIAILTNATNDAVSSIALGYAVTTGGDTTIGGDIRSATTYLDYKANTTGAGGIRMLNSSGTQQGYLYHDGAGYIGLLENTGNWAIRCLPSQGGVYLYNGVTLNAGGLTCNNQVVTGAARYSLQAVDTAGYGYWGNLPTVYGSRMATGGVGGRLPGDTTSDYNIYHHMELGVNRGFVFENGSTKLLGINPDGVRVGVPLRMQNEPIDVWHGGTEGSDRQRTVYHPKGGNFRVDASNQSGAYLITWPQATANTAMQTMIIKGYDYTAHSGWAIQVAGYDWTTGWINVGVDVLYGDPPFDVVKFQRDTATSNQYYVQLGDTSLVNNFQYPQVWIEQITFMYNAQSTAGNEDNWTIGLSTSETGRTTVQTRYLLGHGSSGSSGYAFTANDALTSITWPTAKHTHAGNITIARRDANNATFGLDVNSASNQGDIQYRTLDVLKAIFRWDPSAKQWSFQERSGTTVNQLILSNTLATFPVTVKSTGLSSGVQNAFVAESATPGIWWNETDATTGNRGWKMYASSNIFQFYTTTDAGGSTSKIFSVSRSGTTVTGIDWSNNHFNNVQNIDLNGNINGDGDSIISGIETVTIDSTGDITKSSHGNYLYHQSTSYNADQAGGITFSTSAPSGGVNGDIWFEYT